MSGCLDLVRGGVTRFTFGPNSTPLRYGRRLAIASPSERNRRGLTEAVSKECRSRRQRSAAPARRRGAPGGSWSVEHYSVRLVSRRQVSGPLHERTVGHLARAHRPGLRLPARIVSSIGDQMHANFSSDGRFLAYTSTESGRQVRRLRRDPAAVGSQVADLQRWRIRTALAVRRQGDSTTCRGTVRSWPCRYLPAPRHLVFHDPSSRAVCHPGASILHTHYVPNRDGSRFLVSVRSGEPVPVPLPWC